MGRGASDNRGLPIGRVERYDRKTSTVVIHPLAPVIPVTGDGLHILRADKPGQELGFALNTSPKMTREGYTLTMPAPVPEGALVSITSSRELEARAHRIIAKPFPELLRPMPVDLDVTVENDGSWKIAGTITRPDGRLIPVPYQPGHRMEPARTHPLTPAQLEEQLRKTGGTPFAVRRCTINYDGTLFAPVALLNEVRREFLRLAGEQLDAASRPSRERVEQARQGFPSLEVPAPARLPSGSRAGAARLRLSVYTNSPEGVREAAAAGADTICFEPLLPSGRHLCTGGAAGSSMRSQVLTALDICSAAGTLLVWKLPRIAHDSVIGTLIPELQFLHDTGLAACMSGNPGISRAIAGAAPDIALHGSAGLNLWNHVAATRTGMPYALLTLSPELSRDDIRTLTTLAAARRDRTALFPHRAGQQRGDDHRRLHPPPRPALPGRQRRGREKQPARFPRPAGRDRPGIPPQDRWRLPDPHRQRVGALPYRPAPRHPRRRHRRYRGGRPVPPACLDRENGAPLPRSDRDRPDRHGPVPRGRAPAAEGPGKRDRPWRDHHRPFHPRPERITGGFLPARPAPIKDISPLISIQPVFTLIPRSGRGSGIITKYSSYLNQNGVFRLPP